MAEDTPSPSLSPSQGTPREDGPRLDIDNRPLAPSEFLPDLPSSAATVPAEPVDGSNGANQTTTTTTATTTTSAQSQAPKVQVDAQGRTLNPRSCMTCRRRKVRCDKTRPCNNCRRAHIDCVFPAPGRAPRKVRKLADGRDKELLERLRKLESVVKGMGAEVPGDGKEGERDTDRNQAGGERTESSDADADASGKGSDASKLADRLTPEPQQLQDRSRPWGSEWQGRFENRFGRLVINEGRSRYINNSFWASLSNEVEDLKGILNQNSDDEEENSPGSDPVLGSNHQGWVFGFSSQNVDMLSLHPMPNQIVSYWEVYKDSVDPLVKVLHIPTLEPTVLSAASHLSNLSKGFEVLLFAIYYGATTALTPADCLTKLGEEKVVLLSRYRFAVEQALARANFLTTEEAVVLQAFVIFLICLRRNSDARVIWTLTGLIVRTAQTMGIHRDGSHFGLPPFEIEMRRRLWWQVCLLDTRASEDHGCDPTIVEQSFDTKMPLNINDVDIWPGIKEFPPERQGCTDISFCLIRFEVANTFRRINYIPPGPPRSCQELYASVTLQDKEKWITECHRRLEERYLKHCDMSVPLFWVTATVARLMMSKMWLMVYHPFQRQDGGASLPAVTRAKLFITSLENVEYSILLETESRTMKWGWLFRTYMQWHALAFMLSELCHRTTGELVERAWVAVEKTRDGRWGISVAQAGNPPAGNLWRPLNKLYSRAKEARLRGLQEEQRARNVAHGVAMQQERRYSPNANPMFDHPTRPQVTRAPLSQAQLQRFSEGPTYGQIPVDKHELMKSPRASETMGSPDVGDPIDPAGVSGTSAPQTLGAPEAGPSLRHAQTPGADSMFPTASEPTGDAAATAHLHTPPSFGLNFLSNPGDHSDFGFLPHATSTAPVPTIDLTDTGKDPLRMEGIDANLDLDTSIMDTSGDLNWENWDQLVRQFGMDLDQTFDHRSPLPPHAATASGPGTEEGGGASSDHRTEANLVGAMNWGIGNAATEANLRSGFGMGGGDNFW